MIGVFNLNYFLTIIYTCFKIKDVYSSLMKDMLAEFRLFKYNLQNPRHIAADLDKGTTCPACYDVSYFSSNFSPCLNNIFLSMLCVVSDIPHSLTEHMQRLTTFENEVLMKCLLLYSQSILSVTKRYRQRNVNPKIIKSFL